MSSIEGENVEAITHNGDMPLPGTLPKESPQQEMSSNASIEAIKPSASDDPNRRLSMSSRTHGGTNANIAILKSCFESIIQLKDVMKKHQDIVQKATTTIELLKKGEMPPEAIIFQPLKMICCSNTSVQAKILALDCLGKIFTFNIFTEAIYIDDDTTNSEKESNDQDMDPVNDSSIPKGKILLIEAAILAVNSTFEGEGTSSQIELQIIKVLTGAIVNESMPVHGRILMPAVRQIYNIFLMSLIPSNQAIAQASLIQIIGNIFEKVKGLKQPQQIDESISNGDTLTNGETQVENENQAENEKKLTLAQLEDPIQDKEVQMTTDEIFNGDNRKLFVKDAVLIIRILTKLGMKPIEDDYIDMRSQDMRSKLLSLHLVHWILLNYTDLFSNRTDLVFNISGNEEITLIDGIKKSLCLTLSRNAASQTTTIFEITLEIYYLMLSKLRNEFKYEIPVFFKEIYFPIGEMKNSTFFQKRYILEIIRRLCDDPKIFIEYYLNYDCDTSLTNLWEDIVTYLTNLSVSRCDVTHQQDLNYKEFSKLPIYVLDMINIPELDVNKLPSQSPNPDLNVSFPHEYALKMIAIKCVVKFLRELNSSSGEPFNFKSETMEDLKSVNRASIISTSDVASSTTSIDDDQGSTPTPVVTNVNIPQFENLKQRKTALLDAVKLFNFSPKKGIVVLDKIGFLSKSDPKSVADFLLNTEQLDKKQIGEYLGGSKEENISAMHEFVDLMDFKEMNLVTALRTFLQHFRLPGESQVIDRYMLKFAEKYLNDNPNTFEEADTAYVLSYSIIMLNTDQHSEQVKKRMTLDEFIKNNRGIDNGKDVDLALLEFIFNDIRDNEIVLKDEQDAALISTKATNIATSTLIGSTGKNSMGLFSSRNLNKEAYVKASIALSSKTEKTFSSFRKGDKNFINVTDPSINLELLKSLFETIWMSLLAGLSGPFNEFDDVEVSKDLVDGILISIHLSSLFNLDVARIAFVNGIVRFANIDNPENIKMKNILAINGILDLSSNPNTSMNESWKEIFTLISQFERLKLLSKGVDSNQVPDLMNARFKKPVDVSKSNEVSNWNFFNSSKKSASEQAFLHYKNQKLPIEMISIINSTEMDVKIDKVFSKSSEIEGDGIYLFVQCLVEVAQEEINSSVGSNEPRLFSLQKLVDVCYYNMNRIKVEWTKLWIILNEEFNKFGCSKNVKVAYFAIDSLRQLAERFFNLDELSHFKFQREFLKPFDYVILHNDNLQVKEMVLNCIQYLIVKKEKQIKSGWTTLLEILSSIGKTTISEKFVNDGFRLVEQIIDDKMESIVNEDALQSLVLCLSQFAMNQKYQKVNLKALSTINKLVDKIGKEVDLRSNDNDDFLIKMWLPLLKCYDTIISNGIDLEVRSQALNSLFDALAKHGSHFDEKFWTIVAEQLLFPIFSKLNSTTESEDYWVWLSTTLLQALKKMILLFSTFFDDLKGQLDGYLKLLATCILHSKDPISQSGLLSFKEIILQNLTKFEPKHWNQIEVVINELFKKSSPVELFDLKMLEQAERLRGIRAQEAEERDGDDDDDVDEDEDDDEDAESKSEFIPGKLASTIVSKCRHQYSVIELVYELCENYEFYYAIPIDNIMEISKTVYSSYTLARKFNNNSKLRMRVWNAGLVENLPNLRKQETQSVMLYFKILFNLYCDGDKINEETRRSLACTMTDVALGIFSNLEALVESDDIKRGWLPVFGQLLQVVTMFQDADFEIACPQLYTHILGMVALPLGQGPARTALSLFFKRVGDVYVK